jgi:hypothetical protein
MEAIELMPAAEVPAEVEGTIARVVERGANAWVRITPRLRTIAWYHDLPVWFVIETPELPHYYYRVMQLSVVRIDGSPWLEVTTHMERRLDDRIEVPRRSPTTVRRIPIDESFVDKTVYAVLAELWPPDDPEPGEDGEVDWVNIKLSPALPKTP